MKLDGLARSVAWATARTHAHSAHACRRTRSIFKYLVIYFYRAPERAKDLQLLTCIRWSSQCGCTARDLQTGEYVEDRHHRNSACICALRPRAGTRENPPPPPQPSLSASIIDSERLPPEARTRRAIPSCASAQHRHKYLDSQDRPTDNSSSKKNGIHICALGHRRTRTGISSGSYASHVRRIYYYRSLLFSWQRKSSAKFERDS